MSKVPLDHVRLLALVGELPHPLDEEVDVAADDGLLSLQTLGGEGRLHDLAVAGVVMLVGVEDVGPLRGGQDETLELVGAVVVDVPPGLLSDEGDLVGAEADDAAVVKVVLAHASVQSAADVGDLPQHGEGDPQLGAGDTGHGVEEEVVDDSEGDLQDGRGRDQANGRGHRQVVTHDLECLSFFFLVSCPLVTDR